MVRARDLPRYGSDARPVSGNPADATEMMAPLLEMHGHAVWVAHDAHSALAVADQIAPQMALLDSGLPGLDGYELARRLRRADLTRQTRLVAVTGWGQDGDRAKAGDAL